MKQDKCFVSSSHGSPQEIAALEDGFLSPKREQRLLRHLEECPDCRRHLYEIRAVRSLLKNAPSPLPPRKLLLFPEQVRRGRPILWYPVLRTATAFVAVLVLFLFLAEPLVLIPQPAMATPRPVAVKPSLSISPSPRPAIVAPAITRRAPPTGLSVPVETAYPRPEPSPWIRVTATRTQPLVFPPAGGKTAEGLPLWWPLRAGGILLLGLGLGLTWWAYRRERAFF